GEFGVGPIDDGPHALWAEVQAQLHDRYFASNAFRVWKEQSQPRWGRFEHDATTGAWPERPHVIAWVSRIHGARIAGTPRSVESSRAGDSLRVEIEPGTATAAPHVVYIPERYAATARVQCDGAEVALTRAPSTGLVEVACTG